MPGYHTGPGAYLTFMTGARHSHLDSAGYSLDEDAEKGGESLTPESMVKALLEEERWRQILSSLVICYFARRVYTPEVVRQALAVAGFDWSDDDLTRVGAETLQRKHDFKRREGFDPLKLRVPRRILETPSALGPLDEDFINRAIQLFAESTS